MPIFYNETDDYLERMFQSVNGVLFPGGGQQLDGSKLLSTTQFFVKRAAQAYAQGDYFPVFGHCQGFELLLMAITGKMIESCFSTPCRTPISSVLLVGLPEAKCMVRNEEYAAENISLPISFTMPIEETTWLKDLPQRAQTTLTMKNSTINNVSFSSIFLLFCLRKSKNSLILASLELPGGLVCFFAKDHTPVHLPGGGHHNVAHGPPVRRHV